MVIQLKSVVLSKLPKLRKEMTRIRREGFRNIGEYWHQELLPDHFRPAARTEFQHMQRDREYLEAKRIFGRGQGKVDDLVLSGKSRRFLMHAPRIKATGTGVTIRMDSPVYFRNPKHKTAGHPDKPEEVTRVSQRHRGLIARRLETVIQRRVIRELRTIRPQKVK